MMKLIVSKNLTPCVIIFKNTKLAKLVFLISVSLILNYVYLSIFHVNVTATKILSPRTCFRKGLNQMYIDRCDLFMGSRLIIDRKGLTTIKLFVY